MRPADRIVNAQLDQQNIQFAEYHQEIAEDQRQAAVEAVAQGDGQGAEAHAVAAGDHVASAIDFGNAGDHVGVAAVESTDAHTPSEEVTAME